MADTIKKQFDALKAWSIDLYEELQDRNVHAALKLCKNINTQARKLEYRGRGLSGLPDYVPIVQELKREVSSARAGVQQIAAAMEQSDRLRREAKGVKSVYEKKQVPLFAASLKNATSVMEMVKEADSFYNRCFNFDKEDWFSKFVVLYKTKSFFPRLMTDAINRKSIFRHHAPHIGESIGMASPTTLIGANLRNADLRKLVDIIPERMPFSFKNADLRGANLRGVKVGGSGSWPWDFTGANLRGADIKNANFNYATGLTPDQISSAKNWQSARLPPGFGAMRGASRSS